MVAETWLDVAADSLKAAQLLFDKEHYRSSVSRGYYALFQASTALFLHVGLKSPSHGNWSHAMLPQLFEVEQVRRNVRRPMSLRQAAKLSYHSRCDADYRPRVRIDAVMAKRVRRDAGMVLELACKVTGYDPRANTTRNR